MTDLDARSQKQSVHGSQRSGSRRGGDEIDNGEAGSQRALDEMGEMGENDEEA